VQVLTTPRVRGSGMHLNCTLAKQQAWAWCEVGVPLWRHLMASSSSGSSCGSSRVKLTPKQLKAKLQELRQQSDANAAYLDSAENRNLPLHLQALLQLLSHMMTRCSLTLASSKTGVYRGRWPDLLQ
jgi:hypothetical protein